MITFRLPYIQPWGWKQFHQHLTLRLLPDVETLEPERYCRTVRAGDAVGWISVQPRPEQSLLELAISDSLEDQAGAVVTRVRRMFDLDADPTAIARHLAADSVLRPLVYSNPELRLPCAFDPFEQAIRAIVGQQVTVKAAVTITRRLVERYGEQWLCPPGEGAGALFKLFPSAQTLATASLDNIGMPSKRVATLQRLSSAVADGAFELRIDNGPEALIRRLCELPGIGPWTAEYIALRGFGEADAFPAADIGLLKAPLWGSDGMTARELLRRSEKWRPWRAYAAVHIWHNYTDLSAQAKVAISAQAPRVDR